MLAWAAALLLVLHAPDEEIDCWSLVDGVLVRAPPQHQSAAKHMPSSAELLESLRQIPFKSIRKRPNPDSAAIKADRLHGIPLVDTPLHMTLLMGVLGRIGLHQILSQAAAQQCSPLLCPFSPASSSPSFPICSKATGQAHILHKPGYC